MLLNVSPIESSQHVIQTFSQMQSSISVFLTGVCVQVRVNIGILGGGGGGRDEALNVDQKDLFTKVVTQVHPGSTKSG